MIYSYAQNGYGRKALELFERMMKLGLQANDVTVLSVLLACNNSGLVDEGCEFFESFRKVMPQLVPRALIFAGSSPDLVKYGQRHSRLAALATLQHWGVGGGGLFPVTAGLHFFKSFVLTPHMGMLVASSIIIAAVTTITRAVMRILPHKATSPMLAVMLFFSTQNLDPLSTSVLPPSLLFKLYSSHLVLFASFTVICSFPLTTHRGSSTSCCIF
ncbi:hypothetical protein F2Q68_00003843 [Brassica cretica]|uniref:Pentatricopeptide repeat-containing protein n=1 Tax=Brassica cretica TaxID=69181 RepID=A0A8S9JAR1_BRACR|nr:hypothetical protein F2Q68_00003843 [Brassica cretica]